MMTKIDPYEADILTVYVGRGPRVGGHECPSCVDDGIIIRPRQADDEPHHGDSSSTRRTPDALVGELHGRSESGPQIACRAEASWVLWIPIS